MGTAGTRTATVDQRRASPFPMGTSTTRDANIPSPAPGDQWVLDNGDGTFTFQVYVGASINGWVTVGGGTATSQTPLSRLDFTLFNPSASHTDGGLIKAGTSSAKVTEDTANYKFMSFYFDNGATSGSAEGLYLRLYDTGAGKTAQALRAFTTVDSVAGANARGAHISLSFGATGSISGLGAAVDGTLHIADAAITGGTYAAVSADLNADGASSDPAAVTELSFFRAALQGNATGVGKIDDKAYLIVLDGGAIASGNMVEASTTEANYAYSIRCKINGTEMFLMAASAVG